MGTKCAPSYANLYLGGRERELFANGHLSELLKNRISWHRYIDDVLFFWSGTRNELYRLMDLLAINEYNLTFTMDCSQSKIKFLDLQICVDADGVLYYSLYCKSSSGNTILHASSAHPKQLLDSIPYSQYLTLKRNCMLNVDFHQAADDLYIKLQQRGYSHSLLKKAFNKVQKLNRILSFLIKICLTNNQFASLPNILNNMSR